jgi:hypothetical protein
VNSATTGALIATLVSVAAGLAMLLLFRRCFPARRFARSNEAVSTFSQVVGTVYAVIMAFMLYTVWTGYQTAAANADREAQSMVNLYQLAGQLPEPDRTLIRKVASAYVHLVVNDEWNRMPTGHMSRVAYALLNHLWSSSTAVEAATVSDRVLFDHVLTELSNLSEARRQRLLTLRRRLASILWVVLVVGGILTVSSLCLFNAERVGLLGFKVAGTSALIGLMLFAIYQLDAPFGGDIRVPPDSFQLAASAFDRMEEEPRPDRTAPPNGVRTPAALGLRAAPGAPEKPDQR